ncbi:hypothetical protein ACHAXN_012453 [Cyclotella atomus]
MPSHQNPTGNSKAAKFVAANPLAPLADPFAGMGDDQKELNKEVSDNVNKRVEKAMIELEQKHAAGTNELDDPDRAPTGQAYKELHKQQMDLARRQTAARDQEDKQRMQQNRQIMEAKDQIRRMKFTEESDHDDESEDEFHHLLDEEDPSLIQLREARLAQLKREQIARAENISLGHGTLRTILQDEYLPECTGSSRYVCIHFFQDEFERCKIMDFHLKIVAEEHIECKFLRIDAAKAPFFVAKFKIQVLPSLFVYDTGKEIGRLTGFDGLALNPKKPDEWHTGRLQEWLAEKGVIRYEKPSEEVEEERKRMGIVMRGAVYSDRSGVVDEY